jgi:signal peptide peptidase SppA
MIAYPRVLAAAAGELWAIEKEKLDAIVGFLALKARRGELSADDFARISRPQPVAPPPMPDKIAVLQVLGTIGQRMNVIDNFSGGTSTQQLAADFRAAVADPGVAAIVFEHDSPGGTISGVEELAAEIAGARGTKPIIAHVNSLAASASYWLASAADEIVVTQGGRGGSIGVFRIVEDISAALDQAGIKPEIFRGGENKIADSGLEPLTQRARERAQAEVDDAYNRMVASIAHNRGVSPAVVLKQFGSGLMFSAQELLSRGMADRIATFEATLERFGAVPFNPVANATIAARQAARAEAAAWYIHGCRAAVAETSASLQQRLRRRGLN